MVLFVEILEGVARHSFTLLLAEGEIRTVVRSSEAAKGHRSREVGGRHLGIAITVSVAERGSTRSSGMHSSRLTAMEAVNFNAAVLAIPGESGRETHR